MSEYMANIGYIIIFVAILFESVQIYSYNQNRNVDISSKDNYIIKYQELIQKYDSMITTKNNEINESKTHINEMENLLDRASHEILQLSNLLNQTVNQKEELQFLIEKTLNNTAFTDKNVSPTYTINNNSDFITYSFRGIHYVLPVSIVKKYKDSVFYTLYQAGNYSTSDSYYIDCATTYLDDILNYMSFYSYRSDRYKKEELKYLASDMNYLNLTLPKELFLELFTLSEYMSKQSQINIKVENRIFSIHRQKLVENSSFDYLFSLLSKPNQTIEGNAFLLQDATSQFQFVAEYINKGTIKNDEKNNIQSILQEFNTFHIIPSDDLLNSFDYLPNKASIFFPNSTLMNDQYTYYLRYWTSFNTTWRRIYSSDEDGKTDFQFHNHVDDQGGFMAIMSGTKVGIFGVYLPNGYFSTWRSLSSHDGEGSFIFSLSNAWKTIPKRLDVKEDSNRCIVYSKDRLFNLGSHPIGGDLELTFDRYFKGSNGITNLDGSHCYKNKSGYGRNFLAGPAPIDDISYFDINLVEVYIMNN